MVNRVDNQAPSHFTDIFDFSDTIKNIYIQILKLGPGSIEDFMDGMDSQIDSHELKIYLDILTRQQYLEKYMEDGTVMYRARGLKRKSRFVPEEIWEKLKNG